MTPPGGDDRPTLPPPEADAATLPPDEPAGDATLPHVPGLSTATDLPGYEVLRELGRGGMGVVYEARQAGLNRTVALKMVPGGADAVGLVRFLAEAEAVAAIAHPHVVRVHEFGQHAGRPYLAMEYLPGGSLADRLTSGGRLPAGDAAALVEHLARAVQAAHDAGIVHRDLKPANVLFDAAGEPRVTDFGLAKRSTGSDLTKTGAIMGTPAYMAPEQAGGRGKYVGPAADGYALGVILFECLTGRVPFTSDDLVNLLMKVATEEPPPPRRFAPDVPRDLELICLKCLSKAPAERYPTAAALADDLARFRNGEPVTVRPAGRIERLRKWAKRNPKDAAIVGAVFAVLVAVTVASLWVSAELQRERNTAVAREQERDAAADKAEKAADDAKALAGQLQAEKDAAEALLARTTLAQAQTDWDRHLPADARSRLDDVPVKHRGWEWSLLRRVYDQPGLFTLYPVPASDWDGATQSYVPCAPVFTRDGERVVGRCVGLNVWDARTGKPLGVLEDSALFFGPVAGADGRVYAHDHKGTVRGWDARTGKKLFEVTAHGPVPAPVTALAASPDGKLLAVAGANDKRYAESGFVLLFDAKTVSVTPDGLTGHRGSVAGLHFSADGKTLYGTDEFVTAGGGWFRKTVTVGGVETAIGTRVVGWDVATRAFVAPPDNAKGATSLVAVGPDGRSLAVSNSDRTVLVSADTGEERKEWGPDGLGDEDAAVAFSPDGTQVAVGGDRLTVYDLRTRRVVAEFRGRTGTKAVTFSPDGRSLLATDGDKQTTLWPIPAAATRAAKARFQSGSSALHFAPDGNGLYLSHHTAFTAFDLTKSAPPVVTEYAAAEHLAAGPHGPQVLRFDEEGHVLGVIDPQTGKEVSRFPGERTFADERGISRDGRRVVVHRGESSGVNAAWVRDVETGAEVCRLAGKVRVPVGFTPDGRRVAAYAAEGTGRVLDVYDADTGRRLHTLPDPGLSRIHLLPGGTKLFGTDPYAGGRPAVIDYATRERIDLRGHPAAVAAVGWLPDGSRLLTGDVNGNLFVWDPARGQPVATLGVSENPVLALAVSPDAGRLAVYAEGDRVRVFDLATPTRETPLPGRWAEPASWSFNPDGTRFAALDADRKLTLRTSADGAVVRTWDVPAPPAGATPPKVQFAATGDAVYTSWTEGNEGKAHAWNPATGANTLYTGPRLLTYFTPQAAGGLRSLIEKDGTLRLVDSTPPPREYAARAAATHADRTFHITAAAAHLEAGHWFAAAAQYDLAERLSPLNPADYLARGRARLEAGDPAAARKDFRAHLAGRDVKADTGCDDLGERAMLQFFAGEPAAARKTLAAQKKAFTRPTAAVLGLFFAGGPQCLPGLLGPAAAVPQITNEMADAAWAHTIRPVGPVYAAEWLPPAAGYDYIRAAVLIRAGRPADGLALLEQLPDEGLDAENHYWRALALTALGRRAEAAVAFARGEEWRRKRGDPWFQLPPDDSLTTARRLQIELLREEAEWAVKPTDVLGRWAADVNRWSADRPPPREVAPPPQRVGN